MFGLMIIAVIIFLIIIICYYRKSDSSSNVINVWIREGIKSGIKDIEYPSSHNINIFFNNGTSIRNSWNANKLYSWLSSGEIYLDDELILNFHELPSMSIRKDLNKLVNKFEYQRYLKKKEDVKVLL